MSEALIRVTVKAGAKKDQIRKISSDRYEISVRTAPRQGQANQAVKLLLADHLQLAPSDLRLLTGHQKSRKVFTIVGN